MQKIAVLKDLGLSDNEALLYSALLKSGSLSAVRIAILVDMKRTTVYPILQAMTVKGLVELHIQGNKRVYAAKKPALLINTYRRKLDFFESIIPTLQATEMQETQLGGLRFLQSIDELRQFYYGVLDEYAGKEYRIIGGSLVWDTEDPDFFVRYQKQRAKAKIKTKLLLDADWKNEHSTNPELLRKYQYLPNKYHFESTIDIFDDKVLIVSPKFTAKAVLIAIPAMVDIFRSMFDMLWAFSIQQK